VNFKAVPDPKSDMNLGPIPRESLWRGWPQCGAECAKVRQMPDDNILRGTAWLVCAVSVVLLLILIAT